MTETILIPEERDNWGVPGNQIVAPNPDFSENKLGANPFSFLPSKNDRIRDCFAVGLLLLSVLLLWTADSYAFEHWDVVVVTTLSLGAVTVSFLARANIIFQLPRQVRFTKVALTIPYFAVVLAYLLWDICSRWWGNDFGSLGAGPGVWVGFAGAMLAAQPRDSDLFDCAPSDLARRGRLAILGVLSIVILHALASVIISVIRSVEGIGGIGGSRMAVINPIFDVIVALIWVMIVVNLTFGSLKFKPGAARALGALGIGAATWGLIVSFPGLPVIAHDSVQGGYIGLAYLAALGVAVMHPAVRVQTIRPIRTVGDKSVYWLPLINLSLVVALLWVGLSLANVVRFFGSATSVVSLIAGTVVVAAMTYLRESYRSIGANSIRLVALGSLSLIVLCSLAFGFIAFFVDWNAMPSFWLWISGIIIPLIIGISEISLSEKIMPSANESKLDGFTSWIEGK